ncbi:MAG: phosphodiester glycosidase family protein [Anaerolineae bacterium]
MTNFRRYFRILLVFTAIGIISLTIYFGRRPLRSELFIEAIHPGVDYYRNSNNQPYRTVYHLLEIDLTTPGLQIVGSTPEAGPEYAAQTVRDFAEAHGTQIAINANFFYPFRADAPWDYYPRSGEFVQVDGIAINDGVAYSRIRADRPALCMSAEPLAEIHRSGRCPSGTVMAIAGNLQTLRDGKQIEFSEENRLPRTVVGTNEAGDRLWILVVDGRQPLYSAGATHFYTSKLLKSAGATDVLNLDGGGSATLIIEEGGVQQLFNAPYHTRIVMRERPVANHLGVQIPNQ